MGEIYFKTGFLVEELVGRVDDEGTVYADTGFLSEEDIGRIDNDGIVYARRGASLRRNHRPG